MLPPPASSATGPSAGASTGPSTGPSVGSRALSEVAGSSDLLVDLVDTLRTIDRLTAHVTQLLERGQRTGEVEAATGVGLDLWMSAAGRRTASDRRMLATAAEARGRLPRLADAFDDGRLSWSQVRAVVLATSKLPRHVISAVDDAVAGELDLLMDAEPDALVHLVRQVQASFDTDAAAAEERRQVDGRFLALQPRLDGTGGSLYGELDAVGLAIVSEALDAGTPPPATGTNSGTGTERSFGTPRTADDRRELARSLGQRRADRLVSLCATAIGNGSGGGDGAVTPTLICTMTADSLLGRDDLPAELLTRLTGGRLKVSAPTARRWVQQHGARLRTVVLDETGQVLGVGRRTRVAPGWLADAILVRDRTCREPGCQVAARVSHLDHARPWHPTIQHDRAGTTDMVNLAAVCAAANVRKERDGWQVYGLPDGRRRHHHPRSGLTLDTLPATRTLDLPASMVPAGVCRASPTHHPPDT